MTELLPQYFFSISHQFITWRFPNYEYNRCSKVTTRWDLHYDYSDEQNKYKHMWWAEGTHADVTFQQTLLKTFFKAPGWKKLTFEKFYVSHQRRPWTLTFIQRMIIAIKFQHADKIHTPWMRSPSANLKVELFTIRMANRGGEFANNEKKLQKSHNTEQKLPTYW